MTICEVLCIVKPEGRSGNRNWNEYCTGTLTTQPGLLGSVVQTARLLGGATQVVVVVTLVGSSPMPVERFWTYALTSLSAAGQPPDKAGGFCGQVKPLTLAQRVASRAVLDTK